MNFLNFLTVQGVRPRGRWLLSFVALNGLLALLIGSRYLPWITIPDPWVLLYVVLLFVGQFLFLTALAGSVILIPTPWLTPRLFLPLAVIVATLGQLMLLLDTVVYAQYRFHLSAFVLDLMINAGSDIFQFSWLTWLLALSVVVAVLAVEVMLAWWLWTRRPLERRLGLAMFLGILLLPLLTAHFWHAWADANYDRRITAITPHVPFYHATTAKRFMARHGLVNPQQVRERQHVNALDVSTVESSLDYPITPLQCERPPERGRLNILMIVVDALRADMLDPRWMPATTEFSANAQVFTRHFSNGNATKPGIFSLLYGLPASYWDAFSAVGREPELIRRVQSLGYDTRILGSATLVSPAFDRNAFSSIEDLQLETPGDTAWQRDRYITEAWLEFTRSREQASSPRPFFGFLFYDTTHSYRPPPDYPRFEPYWEVVNQLELDNDFDPEPYFNVYRTTVHYVDSLLDRVYDDLRQRGLLDNTIVMMTSDHGQEFNEHGLNYWGHGSNFSDIQLQVPMVIHWPERQGRRVDWRTEHFDVAPTLLRNALGCAGSDPRSFASGNGLFEEDSRDWTIAHSYMNYALLMPDYQLVTYPAGGFDILGHDLRPVEDQVVPVPVVSQVLDELSRFHDDDDS